MEATPKGKEVDGAELYLIWCYSLRSRDIFFKPRDKNLAAAIQIPNGVFTTLVILIVVARRLKGNHGAYKLFCLLVLRV